MNKPITAICVTFGRVKFLENAIQEFIKQDVSLSNISAEMLVLNTCPSQKLKFESSAVRIVNLLTRPESLGEARNMAVRDAIHERIIIWDDDDEYLPHLLNTFSENWDDDCEWIWLDKRLWAEGNEFKGIVGACHGGCFGFTKRAWREVGGYPNLTVGEDRVLVSKITQQFKGKRVAITGTPPFICRTGQGTYHVSGLGEDNHERMPAHIRVEADFIRRVNNRTEKIGNIVLKPHSDVDWVSKAAAFMDELSKKKPMNKDGVCVIELGRYGDIINILPILLHIHNNYGKPTLMVSREFADLLEGISYVEPWIVPLANNQLNEAIDLANKEFKHVIIAQIWGQNWHQERKCESYNKESWRQAGFIRYFNNPEWMPFFDRRNLAREAALANKAGMNLDKPVILTALQSISSPFPKAESLLQMIREHVGDKYTVLDITPLRSERIFDVLGLMDKAHCLVTVDTALLHLAAASSVPLIALTNPKEWVGSIPRSEKFVQYSYDYAEKCLNALDDLQSISHTTPPSPYVRTLDLPVRKLYHVYEWHVEKNPSEANRKGVAQQSWQRIYGPTVIPMPIPMAPGQRNAQFIGDPRQLPYLKDVLLPALEVAQDDDIIFWTNDDNVLHPDLPEILRYHCSIWGVCCSQRCEFQGASMPSLNRPHVEFAMAGRLHIGRDVFAFTGKWLRTHWGEIPDFILGASDFDLCLATMVRLEFGIQTTRQNLEIPMFPAELERGYVSHQAHPPGWNKPGSVNTLPSNMHNRRLFKEWASTHAPHLVFDQHGCI